MLKSTGDEALHAFKGFYAEADDDGKKAIMKSYQSSGIYRLMYCVDEMKRLRRFIVCIACNVIILPEVVSI